MYDWSTSTEVAENACNYYLQSLAKGEYVTQKDVCLKFNLSPSTFNRIWRGMSNALGLNKPFVTKDWNE